MIFETEPGHLWPNASDPTFQAFPKIERLENLDMIVTEKIDGTNAAVGVEVETGTVWAQSRKRLITPDDDNFGFARWVSDHAAELYDLGEGLHFGEWWGLGIQRGYGQDRKRFSLFNTSFFGDDGTRQRSECCDVVPVLYDGPFGDDQARWARFRLQRDGSAAAPGFMRPEGVMIYSPRLNLYVKHPIEKGAKSAR